MTQNQQQPIALTCPKCGSDMRPYERNGVTIDQCSGCRGVFLDRGELERLTEAEGAYYGSSREAAQQTGRGHQDRERDEHGGEHGSKSRRRPGGFLGELFG